MPPLTHVIAGCLLDEHGQLLVIKQRNSGCFTLPGGPPEHGETPMATLARHWRTMLGAELAEESLVLLGRFRASTAEAVDETVDADVFLVTQADMHLQADQQQVEEIHWLALTASETVPLSPLLIQEVLPALHDRT